MRTTVRDFAGLDQPARPLRQVETNAKEFTWIENTAGDFRGIIRFDLQLSSRITLQWRP
ncbi:MAG: hypothetical protein NTY19_50705 [Planctomycetota bacterium]|nr:hypothetical protein [Planctomycetota bacterium]